jgi:RHS repeat-associated protein
MHRPMRFALVLALALAAPAIAHNRIEQRAPARDLRFEVTAHESMQPLRIIPRDLFADVARIELPRESIADQLQRRFRAWPSAESAPTLRIFTAAVNEKLASGPFGLRDENNVSEIRKIGSKRRWAAENGALPFADPATGLVYARARWFDPQTGSFLSADPAGYRDSSNLYAYCGGDPVNCKDSTGLFGWRDVADFAWGLGSLASSPKEQLKTVGRTAASVAGFVVSFVPGASQVIHETPQNIRRIRQAVAAYRQGGVSGVLQYNREEGERIAASQPPIGDVVLNALPVVGTIRQAMTIPDTYYREGPFFGGMAVGNTTQRAAADATLIYGAAKALDPGPLLVFKAPRTAASPAPLLLAPSKMSNPWLGAPTYAGPAPLGMEIEMAMAPGQINPGEFGTLDTIPDMAYVRGDLAVIPSFKPVISHVQRFQVPAGVQIQTGIVGPQVEGGIVYPGGATQVQILNFADRARLIPIGAPRPLPAPGAPVLP